MRTKQTRRAGGAGTRPKSDGMPYVNPLHLIGACRAAKTSSGRTNDGALFRAEAWRRDARRAAVRGRRTRSRASDEIRAHVAANSATASAPARGNARERTPTLASSCRVASRQNIFSERKIAGIGFGRFAASLVEGASPDDGRRFCPKSILRNFDASCRFFSFFVSFVKTRRDVRD
jgi:hypothetical protein